MFCSLKNAQESEETAAKSPQKHSGRGPADMLSEPFYYGEDRSVQENWNDL